MIYIYAASTIFTCPLTSLQQPTNFMHMASGLEEDCMVFSMGESFPIGGTPTSAASVGPEQPLVMCTQYMKASKDGRTTGALSQTLVEPHTAPAVFCRTSH